MSIGLHVFKDMLDLSVRPDHESSPPHAPDLLAVHVLFFHDAEGFGDLLVGIGQQCEGQILFFLKFLLCFWGIRGYAKQHGACLLNLFICVAEPANLNCSTRGVGPRIEKQDHRFAAQVFERHIGAILVLQSKVWGLIIDFHGNLSVPS